MDNVYSALMEAIRSNDIEHFEYLSTVFDGFPMGVDSFIGRRWIINAIDCGSIEAVKWMVEKGVDLNFRDEEGTTPLIAALYRDAPSERYELLVILLEAGSDPNLKGLNDWTPSHAAAVRNDVEYLKVLLKYGADLSLKTNIDNYATPLEEALAMERVRPGGRREAIEFLRSVESPNHSLQARRP